jgi:succinoglycan biosynthesis transport protein ExoP
MEEKELHLRDYFRVIVKRRHTVFTFFAIIFISTLISTFSTTPVYMATTTILIEKSEPSNLATQNFFYMPYDPDFYETQYQLIKSTSVTRRVVDNLSLDKTYESYFDQKQNFNVVTGTINWFKEIYSVVLNVAGISQPQGAAGKKDSKTESRESKADMLAKTISGSMIVAPIKNTKLLNISFVSPNPEIATLIVNSIVKAYMEAILEMKMSFSKYTMRWLEEKAEEEKGKLEKSEKALQEYMKEKDIITLENRIAMLPERLSEVASKVAEAETKRKEKEILYNQVKSVAQHPEKADTIPAIAADPSFQALRVQILKAEQNVGEISKKYGKKHPAMVTAMDDLRILKEKKDQEIKRIIEATKNEFELSKANDENLRNMVTETKAATLNLNERFIQYGVLKRDAETSKQLFDAIIKRIKEQGITQDIQTVYVSVVEKAEKPESPMKPRKLFNMLMGLMLGVIGGGGMAFFIDYLDNTIKSPEDVETRLSAPVLGIVDLLKTGEKKIEEIVLQEPSSAFAESYRVIRTSILLSATDKPPKNLLITSMSPGEGKTVTAVNLALTIAQSEHSVLLIDGDLRRPRIHKIFGLDNSKGLSSYLAGNSHINVISEGIPSNLSVIPSGPIPPNPSELLGSSRMANLIKVLGGKFDIIVVDSAPLMSVTDSHVLSKILEGTIIVVKAGETTFENVRRGIKNLKDRESHFLGIIINCLDVKKSGYYYYHSYKNYYSSTEKSS